MKAPTGIFCLYGLRIASAVPLPCPESRDRGQSDVELIEASEDELAEYFGADRTHYEDDGFWECSNYRDGAFRICWKEHFDFVVTPGGTRVLWRRLVGVSDEVLFTYLLNQVLSFCLLARGIEPLHATAVVVSGGAVAFLGDSGFGKSTLAASLLEEGFPMLTDDVLVLSFEGRMVLAHPSLPRIKLTPESVNGSFRGRRSFPMNSFTPKMILPLRSWEHVGSCVPLRAVYMLPARSSGSKVSIRRARGRTSFMAVVKNTFNNSVVTRSRIKQQFEFAGRLTKMVPIRQMSYPKRQDLLPAVTDAILEDLARQPESR